MLCNYFADIDEKEGEKRGQERKGAFDLEIFILGGSGIDDGIHYLPKVTR